MRHFLYIKTISHKKSLISPDILQNIAKTTENDIFYVSQKFVGTGFSEFFSSEDIDAVNALKGKLAQLKIESYILDDSNAEKIRANLIDADIITETNNEFIFTSKGKNITVSKSQPILIVIGCDEQKLENSNVQSVFMCRKYSIFAFFGNDGLMFRIDSDSANVSGVRNAYLYSKTENMKILISHLKEGSSFFAMDKDYSHNYIPSLGAEMRDYAITAAVLFNNGFYGHSYDEEFYNMNILEQENEFDYDYNYKIYKPGTKILTRAIYSVFDMNLYVFAPLAVMFGLYILLFGIGPQYYSYALMAAFLYYIAVFIKYFRFKSYIEDIPTSSVKSISVGLREITGSVLETNSIPSLISGTKCVFFRYYKYKRMNTDNGKKWKLDEIGEYLPERFYVQDNGFIMEVDTKNAIMDLNNTQKYVTPYYLMKSAIRNPDIYYIEQSIPVFSDVYIMGSVVSKDSREAFSRYLKNRKSDKDFMKQFDEDNNNEIDINEWENAKAVIASEFEAIQDNKLQNELLRITKTDDDKIMFISDRSEKSIVKNMNIYLICSGLFALASIFVAVKLLWS